MVCYISRKQSLPFGICPSARLLMLADTGTHKPEEPRRPDRSLISHDEQRLFIR